MAETIPPALRKRLLESLSKLPYYEAKVIEFRFGIDSEHPMSIEEVARMIGKTIEETTELEQSALRKIRFSIIR